MAQTTNFVKSLKDLLVRFAGGLGDLVDAVAAVPAGPELKNFVYLIGGVAVMFGMLSATKASSEEATVYSILAIVIGAAVAIKHALGR